MTNDQVSWSPSLTGAATVRTSRPPELTMRLTAASFRTLSSASAAVAAEGLAPASASALATTVPSLLISVARPTP